MGRKVCLVFLVMAGGWGADASGGDAEGPSAEELRSLVREVASASERLPEDWRGELALMYGACLMKLGDEEAGRAALRQGEATIEAHGDGGQTLFEMERVVGPWLWVGDEARAREAVDRAEAMARRLGPEEKAEAFQYVSRYRAAVGQFDEARKLADEAVAAIRPKSAAELFKAAGIRAEIRAHREDDIVAEALRVAYRSGDRARIVEALREARARVDRFGNPEERADYVSEVVFASLGGDDIDAARATLAAMVDRPEADWRRMNAWRNVAEALREEGRGEEALDAARESMVPLRRGAERSLSEADVFRSAALFAELATPEEAARELAAIHEPQGYRRALVLAAFALGASRAGDRARAESLARRAYWDESAEWLRRGWGATLGQPSGKVLGRLFGEGLLGDEVMILRPIGDESGSLRGLGPVGSWQVGFAHGLAESGKIREAARLVDEARGTDAPLEYERLAEEAVRAGPIRETADWAEGLVDLRWRWIALRGLMRGLVGDVARVAR